MKRARYIRVLGLFKDAGLRCECEWLFLVRHRERFIWVLPRKGFVRNGNNPLVFVDPDGEIVWFVPIIVGASFGGYMGYKIGEAKGAEGLEMAGYILGGAAIGGISGYMGASIAAGGGFMANTASIIASSYFNSVSMTALSGGMVQPSISFGFGSYNFYTGEFSYIGNKGNSTLENIGYAFGAMANLQDVVAWTNGTNVDVNSASVKEDWWSHSSVTNESQGIDVSVGPLKSDRNGNVFHDYLLPRLGKHWENYSSIKGTWSIKLYNVNKSILQYATNNIRSGIGPLGLGTLRWNILGFSCVSHVSRSLWAVGVPTLPINFHPLILNTQLFIRQIGVFSSYQLYNY